MLIKPAMRRRIHEIIRKRAVEADGLWFHGIGGTSNHVHMVVDIPPTVLISTWIGKVKGASSHDINVLPDYGGGFEWQTGYGVVAFGKKDLDWVLRYVADQKRHHDENTWEERLERICQIECDEDVRPPSPGPKPPEQENDRDR